MIQNVTCNGVADSIRLSNGTVEAVIATQFGPRILAYAFDGGENVLGWHPDAKVETDLGTWKPYGGRRLWLAPERTPGSYAPDNGPIEVVEHGDHSMQMLGTVDAAGVQKQMTVTLATDGTELMIDHTLTFSQPCHAAAWALTIMRPAGTIVIPNEPFAPYGPQSLLPIRSMALWSYTDLTDPRWSFDQDAIRLRVDGSREAQQKIGILNRQCWAAYELEDAVFTKRTEFLSGVAYPDMNCNFEFYAAGEFVEIETLSPISSVEAGGSIKHREVWSLEVPT